jgi:hypothetical protein
MSEIERARASYELRQHLIDKHTEWIIKQVKLTADNYINVNPIVDLLVERQPGVSRYTLRRTVTKVIELHGAERINPRGVYRVEKILKN